MRLLAGLLLVATAISAQASDPCVGKVTATVISYDRVSLRGAGLLLNYCRRPVKAELLVSAINVSGFMVARIRTELFASAQTLSVIVVDLPFVPSVVRLPSYTVEIATIESYDAPFAFTATSDPGYALAPDN